MFRRDRMQNGGICPGCAREGVFGLQAAGASHWAEGRYSSVQEHDSTIWTGGKLKFGAMALCPSVTVPKLRPDVVFWPFREMSRKSVMSDYRERLEVGGGC